MIDQRILFRSIEARGLEHESINIRLAIPRLHRDRHRRNPPNTLQLRNVLLRHIHRNRPIAIAHSSNLRHHRCRPYIQKIPPIRRSRNHVVCIFRRQQLHPTPIEIHPIHRRIVRIATRLFAHRRKINHPRLLIDVQHFGHIAIAMRDLILQRTRRHVVQIHLPPVVAFAEPQQLVRPRKIPPVLLAHTTFKIRRNLLRHHLAHVASGRIGHAHPLLLVVARRRDERQMHAVFAPLHIVPAMPASRTVQVIAQARSMLIRSHLQPHHLARLHIDHHPLNHCHHRIPRQRIVPRLQRWMSTRHTHQVHPPNLPLVLLKRRNLLRVRRPHQDRTVAMRPSRIVGRIAIVGHTIRGQLCLLPGRNVPHPQIILANERRLFLVRRKIVRLRGHPCLRVAGCLAFPLAAQIAPHQRLPKRQHHAAVAILQSEIFDRKMPAIERCYHRGLPPPRTDRFIQRSRNLPLIERRRLCPLRWIDQHKSDAVRPRIAIPEPPIAQPHRLLHRYGTPADRRCTA